MRRTAPSFDGVDSVTRRRAVGVAVALVAASAAASVAAQSAEPTRPPALGEMKPLGQDRFQLGAIVVDKRARQFRVPGRIHLADKPLEYLAGSPGARKAYETLLELQASGTEFNLACILIGLERDPGVSPTMPVIKTSLKGPKVQLSVAWTDGGQRRQLSAAEALFGSKTQPDGTVIEWIYTGSFSSRDGSQFAADRSGALIGFIHDATTVIETAAPIGIGAYGSVRGNPALPAVGTAIELIVEPASPAR